MILSLSALAARSAVTFAAGLSVCCAIETLAMADQFTLRDGRIVTGKLISSEKFDKANPGKTEAATDVKMVVEVESGVQVVILNSDLVLNTGHRPADSRELAYEKAAIKIPNTPEEHYRIAQQCAKAGLKELSHAHFLRAVDLNPDFEHARAAVGHRRNNTGRWVRVEDDMHRMGKIEVGSKWVYPEHAQEVKQNADAEAHAKIVKKEIQRFHQEFLKGGPKANQVLAAVEQLNDPVAVDVFAEKLVGKTITGQKPTPDALKLVYIRLLSKFDSVTAVKALARASIFDASEQVRNQALDVLINNKREWAIEAIRGLLGDSNNDTINRAAFALGKLNASEATLDLINALVTKHEVAIRPQGDNYTAGGMAMGGPKSALREFNNEQVRNALAQITGQGSLGYDKSAWLTWFAKVYAAPVDDLRRDF